MGVYSGDSSIEGEERTGEPRIPGRIPKDQHVSVYTQQGLFSPTVPQYPVHNPGYAEVEATQIWGLAEADVIREGMTPQAAAEKALKRIEQILTKYPIVQT